VLSLCVDDFTEINRSTIAELPGPVSELVASVTHSEGIHSRKQPVSRKHLSEFFSGAVVFGKIEKCRDFSGKCDQSGSRNLLRGDSGITGTQYLTSGIDGMFITRQFPSKSVVEVQRLKCG
jgi:hypothetical protein